MAFLSQGETSILGDMLSWVGLSEASEKIEEEVVVKSDQVEEEMVPPSEEVDIVVGREANVESQDNTEPNTSPPTHTDEL